MKKQAANSVDVVELPTAIGSRLFTRKRGRIICYDRYGTNAQREIQECNHGVAAAHPSLPAVE